MSDVSTPGYRRPLGLALWTSACLWLAGCEQLLDLPNNPRLAEDTPASGAGGSAIGTHPNEARGSHDEPWSEGDEPVVGSAPGAIDVPPSAGLGAVSADDPGIDAADAGAERRDAGDGDAASPGIEPEPLFACGAGETLGPDGRCYIVVGTALSWTEARLGCIGRGTGWDLAAVRSPAVNVLLADMGAGEAWIGASDAEEEGTWVWVNEQVPFWSGSGVAGSSLGGEYENWNSDEPNGGGFSNCARLVVPRASNVPVPERPTWADLECFELLASVCEGPATPTAAAL